jgi:hypothetical protein
MGAAIWEIIIQKISMLRYQNYTVITTKNTGFTGIEKKSGALLGPVLWPGTRFQMHYF